METPFDGKLDEEGTVSEDSSLSWMGSTRTRCWDEPLKSNDQQAKEMAIYSEPRLETK